MTIDDYFGEWSKVIDLKEADRVMRKLLTVGRGSASPSVCPLIKDIFKSFKLCPLHNLQVLILGQDPYSNLKPASAIVSKASPFEKVPVATGLAFANSSDTPEENYSPSLEILKESVIDYTKPHGIVNFDQSLEKWEEQGVLLLNSALSCTTGKTGSHSLLWRPFIQSLLTNLSRYTVGIVYVLMGNEAQSFESFIYTKDNFVIRCRHPAYYARTNTRMPSDIWRQINAILIGQRGYGIEWYKEEKFSNNQ